MTASDRLKKHRDHVLAVLDRRKLRNPRLFGSAARGNDHESSDVDILVDAPPGTSLFDLAAAEIELEQLLGCRTEIVTDGFLSPDVRRRIADDLVRLS